MASVLSFHNDTALVVRYYNLHEPVQGLRNECILFISNTCDKLLRSEIHYNTLWPGDAIWRHRSCSMLAQVMAWYLTAPLNHYPKQYWLTMVEVLWHLPRSDFTASAQCCTGHKLFKITILEVLAHLPGFNVFIHVVINQHGDDPADH